MTTIVSYEPRVITRQDGSSFTLHKFKDVNGTELVARSDVANLTRGYLNQPVKVTVRSEQKGQYMNHYLDHVAPSGQQQYVQEMQQPAYVPAQQAQQAQTRPIPPPTPPPPPQQQLPHELDAAKDAAIHRQTAAKVAAALSTTANEFWRNVVDLAFYFDTGQVPSTPQPDDPDDGIPF